MWERPYDTLREKWHEVPAGGPERASTRDLVKLSDAELLEIWTNARRLGTAEFAVRGWYHLLYKDVLRGKRVIDVGSGLGIDSITFAQAGAHVTFLDIVPTNLEIIRRLCRLFDLQNTRFVYLEDLDSLKQLPAEVDVLWCQGSLINAPQSVIRPEVQELLKHLPIGGRFIMLAYPKIRWEREGSPSFEKWGETTDGGAPWVEWYDLEKVRSLLAPAEFEVVLYQEFNNADFNWFDLVRRK